ncbi:hypothetical protein LSTR_LSTR008962 [Laodelphax striatellus]|uniref:LRRCT domain-containing protein n=1 Tax=Laodelphax striatellus TaxID=195883 RepID=A0A482WJZ9_LAOST|nr:hypothetical protein LSTR_LSTR008962 [Laodelphax striatellus]
MTSFRTHAASSVTWKLSLLALLTALALAAADPSSTACDRILRELRQPCRCLRISSPSGGPELGIDCDRTAFPADFPHLPYGAPLVYYTQRHAGLQSLPTPAFTAAGLPVRVLDFSYNSLRRLPERVFLGLQDSLQELRLSGNLLGDSLNPIFSSSEFHGLSNLRLLDLSGNQIKAIEEGLLKGCDNLRELWLNDNSLTLIPSTSLNGPTQLKVLSLSNNRISSVKEGSFLSQRSLESLDLTGNRLQLIEGGAFKGLSKMRILSLGHNRLVKLNSDVFTGAQHVEELDLSANFLSEFPTVAAKAFDQLKLFNLSSNLIERLDDSLLSSVPHLEVLDLSRNNIANIAPGTFLSLRQLRHLDLSVNSLRTVEDDAFEGLDSLETLSLQDNNILLVPASAIGRLPHLTTLQLDFNRVAAISADILRAIADRVTTLGLARNVIRELPADAFQDFKRVEHLDLSGNLLLTIEASTFAGLEESLLTLDLQGNRLSSLPAQPLALAALQKLNISNNRLKELPRMSFMLLPGLLHLDISKNPQLTTLPLTIFQTLTRLKTLNVANTGIKQIPPEFFIRNTALRHLYLQHNHISEIADTAFQNQNNLTKLDISYNQITNIRPGAFLSLTRLKSLDLQGNKLTSFKGEFFIMRRSNGTSLEELNLDDNELSYLFPSSFRVHPRLQRISAARNKFNFFPAELITSLNYLQEVDLSHNLLKTLEEFDFGRLPRLRVLKLDHNELDTISETAFHNSTQLQVIDLAGNKLERLGERTFQGLGRLQLLNLRDNFLTELPESIFERSRLKMLENVDLSGNLFEIAPLKTLQRQYFFLSSVDLSRNKLTEIAPDDSIMVNIKKLDLSFNPLTPESITNVLGEPKTVRELNMAGTGITHLTHLETPFLLKLNLSYNSITDLPDKVFDRPTLLEVIDLSYNQITDFTGSISPIWKKLKNLQYADVSGNPIRTIVQGDLDGLESLRKLKISSLNECTRLEKVAFKSLTNLAELEAYGYPKLGYLDVTGLLHSLPALESLDVEVKDSAVGSDQLSAAMNPRLKRLGIRGSRVQSISSGALAGLKSHDIKIELKNTSLNSLPPALLIPLPRSSMVSLDVTGNKLTTLTAQFLSALDDRRSDITLEGLSTNPILCDCGARALRRSGLASNIRCSAPAMFHGNLLVEIADDDLTCDPHRLTSTTTTPQPSSPLVLKTSRITTEPDIIWSLPPMTPKATSPKILMTNKPPGMTQQISNDDTLIISIVGGVVGFIAILTIIICIVRLRWTDNQYRGGPLAAVVQQPHCNNPSCPCPKMPPPPHPLYTISPQYAATLPHKMLPPPAPASISPGLRASYSTLGRQAYIQNQPYYVPFPPDEKEMSLR